MLANFDEIRQRYAELVDFRTNFQDVIHKINDNPKAKLCSEDKAVLHDTRDFDIKEQLADTIPLLLKALELASEFASRESGTLCSPDEWLNEAAKKV